MENHVYKHHFRHGHHHHKHDLFYALLAMVFFATITLGVVASIYYTMLPSMDPDTEQSAREEQSARCLPGYPDCNDTPNQPSPAAGACLVGTVDCNDTPELSKPNYYTDYGYTEYKAPSEFPSTYFNQVGRFQVLIPANLGVYGQNESQVSIGEPDQKWVFGIDVRENFQNLNLSQAFEQLYSEIEPSEYSDYKDSDVKFSNIQVDGVVARRATIDNYGDNGGTLVVFLANGKIYRISGTAGESWTNQKSEWDVINFLKTFEFIN